MNADGGMGLEVLVLAFGAVVLIVWGLWGLARLARKEAQRKAAARLGESARLQREQDAEAAYNRNLLAEQQARDGAFVQADPGTTESMTGSPGPGVTVPTHVALGRTLPPYPSALTPTVAPAPDPRDAKARALLARAKLAKAKKRRGKKK